MAYGRLRKVTKEQLQEMANNSVSIAGVIRLLGYKEKHGSSYHIVKKYLQIYDIKTDHWKGQAWSKGDQLKDWSQYNRAVHCKKHLIKDRGHICENCKLSEWLEQPIKLEVHHIDGNRTNNEYFNLKLLCPNCHAYTDSWRKRRTKN